MEDKDLLLKQKQQFNRLYVKNMSKNSLLFFIKLTRHVGD